MSSSKKQYIEFKTRVPDKIEAARSYDSKANSMPRPFCHNGWPDIVEADARQDAELSRGGEGVFDILTDDEDGMMAMFKAIRDLLFPPDDNDDEQQEEKSAGEEQEEGTSQGKSRNDTSGDKKRTKKRMPAWQVDTIDQFLRAWHHVEVSTAARLLVTDEDYSVVTIFREVGTETFDELSLGTRRLSQAVLANMRVAVEAARRLGKKALVDTAAALVPEAPRTLSDEAVGDVSMAGMFKPEEWS